MSQNLCIEILPDKLYWINGEVPKELTDAKYFSIDKAIKYKPIYSEHGPHTMYSIQKFGQNLHKILK